MKRLLLFTLSAITLLSMSTQAVGASSSFQAGRIIDDEIFVNRSSMSVVQIQNFLNSKVPTCDTNGQQTSEYGGTDLNGDGRVQRWEWGKVNYNQTTFPCLKDYRSSDGRIAAQIIYDISQTYRINPQVLMTLLQKEQGLVTDTWPLNIQYQTATGYACPDNGSCNTAYYGLVNQLDRASNMYRKIMDDSPDWYTPYNLGNNYIRYNPNSSCGGSTVYIQNRATQALYNYTPYQPNQAALDAGWGTAPCGAYGNRNFFLYFTNWFGGTYANQLIIQNVFIDQSLQISPSSSNDPNQSHTATFRIRNNSNTTINLGYMFVSVRDIDNRNLDFPAQNITIQPNSTYTYSTSRTFPSVGKLKAYIGGNISKIGWTYDIPYSTSQDISRETIFYAGTSIMDAINNSVRLEKSLNVTPTSSTDPNQIYTATFTVKNTSNSKIDLGFMFAAVRDASGSNYDFPSKTIVLQPNSSYTYSASRTFPQLSKLSVYVGGKFSQIGWDYSTPQAIDESIVRSRSIIPKSDVVLMSPGISVTKINETDYQATATFKNNSLSTQNVGWFLVSARTPTGQNVDFPIQNIIIPPGETATYSQTRSIDLTELGKFRFFTNLHDPINGYGWTTTYPASDNVSAVRETSFVNGPNVIQTKEIETQTLPDGSIKATVSYTNFGSQKEYMGWVILSTRLGEDPTNYDFKPQEVTINAGETRTLTFSKRFIKAGNYTIRPVFYKWPNWWSSDFAPLQKPDMSRTANFTSSFAVEQVGDITINRIGNNTTASIVLVNKSSQEIELGSIVISVRNNQGSNVDFPIFWAVLKPGETKTFTTSRTLEPGTYHITATAYHYMYGWGATFKVNTDLDYTLL